MNIILGITGGIAAYKSCELVRLLVKAKHQVKVVMTQNAKLFIHPNTFSALSQNRVFVDLFDDQDSMLHITLAKWADKIIIAPTSATTISKLAQGMADNLLTAICLASEAPCFIAAAMNKIMWEKSITQQNIVKLQQQHFNIIMPSDGEQACGDIGAGRMVEPQQIFDRIFQENLLLKGLRVLITAGPTQEKIDPIRYITNHSSGKMGYALADAYQQQGADVTLISGPTQLQPPVDCKVINVTSAQQMLNAVIDDINDIDIVISAAAVADYTPCITHSHKLKKQPGTLTLTLDRTTDILQHIAQHYPKVFLVGFCAETQNLVASAKKKLTLKYLNAIIANQISENGYPFNADTNTLIYINYEKEVTLEKNNKHTLAKQLIQTIQQDYSIQTARLNTATEHNRLTCA